MGIIRFNGIPPGVDVTNPTPLTWRQHVLVAGLLCAGAWLGLHVSLPGTSVGILWPPAGLALGFLLKWGKGIRPAVLWGSFLQTLLVQGLLSPHRFMESPLPMGLIVLSLATSTYLTHLLAAWLVQRHQRESAFSLPEARSLFVWGGLVAQLPSAVSGIGIFVLSGGLSVQEAPRSLFVWWASNVTSVGLLALWMAALWRRDVPASSLSKRLPVQRFALVTAGTALSFFLPGWLGVRNLHLELLVVFPVLMTAFALGTAGAATAALLCASVTLAGTLLGYGAFAQSGSFSALLSLQAYLLTVMGASLALGDTRRRWREARSDLETSEAWFREVFHGVHDAVLVLFPGADLQVDRANRPAARLMGLEASGIHGPLPPAFVAKGPFCAERREHTQALLEAGEVVLETWEVPQTEGIARWVEGTLQGVSLGGHRRLLVTLRDVTDRVVAEAEGERLRRQLIQSQKLEALGLLAAGVAHDFNNLLGAIQGYADLLAEEADPSSLDTSRRLAGVVRRGQELTRTLLVFGRPGSRELQPIDLNVQIATSLDLLRRVSGPRIEVRFTPAPGTALMEGNPGQLDQILVNLACNARDAMSGAGVLEVATHHGPAEGHLTLAVRDTGTGMDEATLRQVFEPFFTTKDQDKGTGLGLSTVREIVKAHQGTIEVESAPGSGTTFRLRFPKLA